MSSPQQQRRIRLSLRARWTAVLLIVVLAAISVYAVLGARIQRRGLADAERALEVAVTDHVADLFMRTLRDAADATHRVGLMLTEAHVSDDEVRLRLAQDILAHADALTQVAIYEPSGALIDVIVRKGETLLDPPEHLAPEVLHAVQTGDWLPLEYREVGAQRVALFRYLEPVVRDGEQRALVLGTLGVGLTERIRSISEGRFDGRDDGVLILDRSTRVAIGPATGALAVGTELHHDVLSNLPNLNFDRDLGVATEFTAASGEAMVGSIRTLAGPDFALVVRRPASAVYASLHSAQRLLLFAGLVLAALAVLVGTWLAARTTRSVGRLVALTGALARRDFNARWTARSGDEMDLLGDSLTDMAQQLAASEREVRRRAAVEADLSRFLPEAVALKVAAGEHKLALGGARRRVSVLFADVVSFTTFSEEASPEQVVAFLNELFTVLSEVVFRHGGTVDKFIGDCVMAIFGAPVEQEDHAARALAAAEDMHRFVETSAPAWRDKYGVDAHLGIGVNAGEALVGNLGSERRMEYTAIGDVVNVAARLEGLARAGQTLVTAELARAAGPEFSFLPRGEHPLRGKKLPVEILELQ